MNKYVLRETPAIEAAIVSQTTNPTDGKLLTDDGKYYNHECIEDHTGGVKVGDYLIKYADGELVVVSKGDFERMYQLYVPGN